MIAIKKTCKQCYSSLPHRPSTVLNLTHVTDKMDVSREALRRTLKNAWVGLPAAPAAPAALDAARRAATPEPQGTHRR